MTCYRVLLYHFLISDMRDVLSYRHVFQCYPTILKPKTEFLFHLPRLKTRGHSDRRKKERILT